jgi:hypothetical protein
MKTGHAWLLAFSAVWVAGSFAMACGSSSAGFADGGHDSGPDITTDQTSMFDVMVPDNSQPHPEGSSSDSPITDGGEGGIVDTGIIGNCSPVNGPACDLVKQNCKKGQECVLVSDPDAATGETTACRATQASENRPVGAACCPNNPTNQCDPGLTCIGDTCIGDAGSGGGGGQCAPACCPATDSGPGSNNCGSSAAGYIGQCNLQITGPSDQVLFTACTYESKCIPLGVVPCATGFECNVEGPSGTADCTTIFNPDGGTTGAPAGADCPFANSCDDGLACLTVGMADAATCLWFCHVPGQATPFDAGVLNGTPGHGGCPSGYTCEGAATLYPPWLGACVGP